MDTKCMGKQTVSVNKNVWMNEMCERERCELLYVFVDRLVLISWCWVVSSIGSIRCCDYSAVGLKTVGFPLAAPTVFKQSPL